MSKQKTDDSLIESHTAAIGGYKVNFSNPSGMDIDIPFAMFHTSIHDQQAESPTGLSAYETTGKDFMIYLGDSKLKYNSHFLVDMIPVRNEEDQLVGQEYDIYFNQRGDWSILHASTAERFIERLYDFTLPKPKYSSVVHHTKLKKQIDLVLHEEVILIDTVKSASELVDVCESFIERITKDADKRRTAAIKYILEMCAYDSILINPHGWIVRMFGKSYINNSREGLATEILREYGLFVESVETNKEDWVKVIEKPWLSQTATPQGVDVFIPMELNVDCYTERVNPLNLTIQELEGDRSILEDECIQHFNCHSEKVKGKNKFIGVCEREKSTLHSALDLNPDIVTWSDKLHRNIKTKNQDSKRSKTIKRQTRDWCYIDDEGNPRKQDATFEWDRNNNPHFDLTQSKKMEMK